MSDLGFLLSSGSIFQAFYNNAMMDGDRMWSASLERTSHLHKFGLKSNWCLYLQVISTYLLKGEVWIACFYYEALPQAFVVIHGWMETVRGQHLRNTHHPCTSLIWNITTQNPTVTQHVWLDEDSCWNLSKYHDSLFILVSETVMQSIILMVEIKPRTRYDFQWNIHCKLDL